MGKLKIVGIGISVFVGLFLILMAIAVSNIDSSSSIENLQSKITILESENDKLRNGNTNQGSESEITKLKAQNSQLQFKIDNIQKKDEMTCYELYDIRVDIGLKTMTMDSLFEGDYSHLIANIPNDSAKSLMNEVLQLSNKELKNLDEIKNNQKLYDCDLSDEQSVMIVFLDMYEMSVGE